MRLPLPLENQRPSRLQPESPNQRQPAIAGGRPNEGLYEKRRISDHHRPNHRTLGSRNCPLAPSMERSVARPAKLHEPEDISLNQSVSPERGGIRFPLLDHFQTGPNA